MSDDVIPIDRNKNLTGETMDAKKKFWAGALEQLVGSERFIKFVDANYTIGVAKDEETKTVEVLVTEKPIVVGPPLTGEQHFKLALACNRSGAKDPQALLGELYKILGQEPKSSLITSASEKDLQRALDDASKQEELKKGLDV